MQLNSKTKQKIDIMRQAEVNIGAAILGAFEMMKTDLMAYLSQEIDTVKKQNQIDIKQLSSSFVGDISEIKSLVEQINIQEIDEDKIVENLAEKIVIPTPINGHTPTEEELLKIITPLIPKIENGKTPTKEELLNLIRPLIPKVENGRPPPEEELIAIIKPLIPEIQLPDFAKMIQEALSQIQIDASQVKNLPKGKSYKHGGGDQVKAGSGITITVNSDGSKTITSSAAASIMTPTLGAVNGINRTYTFPRAPTVIFVDGGNAMLSTSQDETTNWTGSNPVTLTVAPVSQVFAI